MSIAVYHLFLEVPFWAAMADWECSVFGPFWQTNLCINFVQQLFSRTRNVAIPVA